MDISKKLFIFKASWLKKIRALWNQNVANRQKKRADADNIKTVINTLSIRTPVFPSFQLLVAPMKEWFHEAIFLLDWDFFFFSFFFYIYITTFNTYT